MSSEIPKTSKEKDQQNNINKIWETISKEQFEKINDEIDYFQHLKPSQILSIEQMKQIQQKLQTLKDVKTASLDLFAQLSNGLFAIRSVQSQEQERITEQINITIQELIQNSSLIIENTIKKKQDVDLAMETDVIIEQIDLIKRTSIEKITKEIIEPMRIICVYGSANQTHQLFQIGLIQILSQKLKNENEDIQKSILQTLIHIIEKGWQQLQYKQQSSSTQSHLQQLLNPSLPHPYLDQLEQQQIITIILDIILNDESEIKNKKKVCQLLDVLYFEGFKLPNNLKPLVIKMFCDQSKSEVVDFREYSLESLYFITANQENHDAIISEGGIEIAIEYLKRKQEDENISYDTFKYSLNSILNLFTFGTTQTKQIIKNSISIETLNNLKKQLQFFSKEKVKQLLSTFSDPNEMKEIVKIGRFVQNRCEEGQIDLVKAGLLSIIYEIIKKAISKEEGEGEIIYISENILKHLIYNQYNNEIIIQLTEFFENYLHLLNSLPLNKLKSGNLNIFYNHLYDHNNELNQKLFEKGIIQSMVKILECQDQDVREEVSWIILNVIKLGAQKLKEGQQHPYYQQLLDDGTISKFIKIFKDEYNADFKHRISQTIAYLFKSLPLPPDIRKEIVDKLKPYCFEELTLLSENPDNHDAILEENFENELFQHLFLTIENLQLSHNLLQYGSNSSKIRVALAIKDKVEGLLIDEYLDMVIINNRCISKDQLISKIKDTVILIKTIEEQIEEQGEFEEINSQKIQNKQD